jgi:ribosomal protein S18 acetylase RimI-like enzyme
MEVLPTLPQATSAIRRVRPEDRAAVVRVLARAFDADPVANYLLRQDRHRARAFELCFGAFFQHMAMPHGECWMAEDGMGAALWTPPGCWDMGLASALAMAPALIRAAGITRAPRVGLLANRVQRLHPEPPHFYLFAIGVDPDAQGRGIGSALLREVLTRCDARKTPAYLEASRPENARLYQRHGFQPTQQVRMADDAPPMWLMWRDPQGAVAG